MRGELVAAKVSDKLSETSSSGKGGRPGKAFHGEVARRRGRYIAS
jgi:hypothetical protein